MPVAAGTPDLYRDLFPALAATLAISLVAGLTSDCGSGGSLTALRLEKPGASMLVEQAEQAIAAMLVSLPKDAALTEWQSVPTMRPSPPGHDRRHARPRGRARR